MCLLVLTSDGFLKVLNADTGAVLRSIYISTEVVFRYVLFGHSNESYNLYLGICNGLTMSILYRLKVFKQPDNRM